ncbi:MAG: metallophosphoesterase family protein [Planctomycetota bacterium]|jgi:diadenosine tetraphosphatase ApaH/serine/threonine PP2A family protein phosphatase
MAMKALISDIHGNVEALEAVLREIRHQGIDEIWCIGDIVGYGPGPVACADLVRRNCSLTLMGNHDWALLNSPVGFNTLATAMIYKTKEWMRVTDESTEQDKERWNFLSQLPLSREEDGLFLVHASPRAELSEYILPSDVSHDPGKFEEIFSMIDRVCVVGHSHVPCCITEDMDLAGMRGESMTIELDERKRIINIGSVGQPRDGDNRACFVTFNEEVFRYNRVPYDYRRTMAKINKLGDEYQMLGYRLGLGR